MRARSIAVALMFAVSIPLISQATEIPLTVSEPSGVARIGGPVTSGVPIAVGDTAASWALIDEDTDTEIPVQTKLLRGGLTNWLLVDFRSTVGASTSSTYTLKTQSPTVSASPAVTVEDSTTYYVVKTGPLKVRIGKSTFNLFDEVWLDRNHSGTFSDSIGNTERLVTQTSADNLPLRTANDTVCVGRRAPHAITWEDQGALRSTLRVDGHYARTGAATDTLLLYTTRITFYAGQTFVDVRHLVRCSFLAEKRYVKVKSAQLVAGPGGVSARATKTGNPVWILPASGAATLEALPLTQVVSTNFTVAGGRTNTTINVDGNGGLVIPDLSHHAAFARFDFCDSSLTDDEKGNRRTAYQNRLFARAEPSWYSQRGAFGGRDFSTFEEEKSANTNWSWSWPSGGSNPCWSSAEHSLSRPDSTYLVSWSTVSSSFDLESDDLWQQLMMYARVGHRTYLDRADRWARYYASEFAWRTDGFAWRDSGYCEPMNPAPPGRPRTYLPAGTYTQADKDYLHFNAGYGPASPWSGGKDEIGHSWNGGLIDYYYMTGDRDALAAAIDIAEFTKKRLECVIDTLYHLGNVRVESRGYLKLLRTWEATGDTYWRSAKERFRQVFLRSKYWDSRGFYYAPVYALAGNPNFPGINNRYPNGRWFAPFELGEVPHVFYLDYLLSGANSADSLKSKLASMASFAFTYGGQADTAYTGSFCILDSLDTGVVRHHSKSMFEEGETPWPSLPGYSSSFLDALTIGSRLTSNAETRNCYMSRARKMWAIASKYRLVDDGYTLSAFADSTQVGTFLNSMECKDDQSIFFEGSGQLTNAQYYFHDAVSLGDFVAPGTVGSLSLSSGKFTIAATWQAPGDDGGSGTALEYDLRYSTSPITNENFMSASTVLTSTPQSAGTLECKLLSSMASCVTYYFAIKTRDDGCNWSAISNLPSVQTNCSGNAVANCDIELVFPGARDDAVPVQLEFGAPALAFTRGPVQFQLGFPLHDTGARVELLVFDVSGRKVSTLFSGVASPGRHPIEWDLRDAGGNAVRAGAYFLSLRVGDTNWNRKLILVR